ncbi:response regulator transcription factor [Solicola sp. PLA-1-18]|uniref:response regulator transcription factor n=1 Tax=Solicola sp. PLA-1-18 TaxID=3380532 RepID=UPI003B81176E
MSTTLLDQDAVVRAAVAGGACAPCARLVLAIVAGAAAAPVPDDPLLTEREQAVLVLLERGLTAAQIGRRLGISAATVRKHLEHVYAKLGVHDRLSATRDARRRGLLQVDVGVTAVTTL